jgi:hypothetical protein
MLEHNSGLKEDKRAESRQARSHCHLSRKLYRYDRNEIGRKGTRKLTTLSRGIFRPTNHPLTSRVLDWGFRDGQRNNLDGVSNLVQITFL